MKSILLLIVLLPILSFSQNLSKLDTGKYSIELPDYWKPGNKAWRILSNKLPVVSPELKDKELCGDRCNPKYRIVYHMKLPEFFDYSTNRISSTATTETFDFLTWYSFEFSLFLLNEKDELITRFIIVDTNEVWKSVNRAELQSYRPGPLRKPAMNTYTYPYTIDLNGEYNRNTNYSGMMGETPFAYINKNKEKLEPQLRELFAIVDNKILSWEKE